MFYVLISIFMIAQSEINYYYYYNVVVAVCMFRDEMYHIIWICKVPM